jgi:hypothetical protein
LPVFRRTLSSAPSPWNVPSVSFAMALMSFWAEPLEHPG